MRVDVVDVFRIETRVAKRHRKGPCSAFSSRRGRGDVIGVSRGSVTDDLSVDLGSARLRMLIFLKHENSGAFGHDESIAVLVKRTARTGRIIVPLAQRLHGAESGETELGDRRLRSSGNHDVRIIALDHPVGFPDGVARGRTGGHHRHVRAFCAVAHREGTRRHVNNHHRDQERTDSGRSALNQQLALLFHGTHSADAAPDADTDPVRINSGAFFEFNAESGVLHGLVARSNGIQTEIIKPSGLFFGHVSGWIEISDFARNMTAIGTGVKSGYGADAASAFDQGFPCFFNAVSKTGNRADSGNYYSPGIHSVLLCKKNGS